MLRVGLTGGIGAGKSAVAGRLAELGAVVVDSDVLAREVVAPGTPGLAAVVEAFGATVLDAAGGLDRGRLGELVFAEPDARRRLEGIIHPLVRRRSVELTAAAAPDAVVVNDVPLLVEVGLAPTYHLVVVVEADPELRVERLVGRGMTAAAARARIAAQASDERRRAAADALLDNSGSRDELRAAVDALWAERLLPFERNVRAARAVRPPDPPRLVDPDPAWPARYARIEARLRHAAGDRAVRIDHIGATAVPGLPAEDVIDVQLVVPDLAAADALAGDLAAAGYPPIDGAWRDDPPPADDEAVVPTDDGPVEPAAAGSVEPAAGGSVEPAARGMVERAAGRVVEPAADGMVERAARGSAEPAGGVVERAVLVKRVHGGADPAELVRVHVRGERSPVWREVLAFRDRLRAEAALRDSYAELERKLAGGPGVPEGAEVRRRWLAGALAATRRWAAETGWRPARGDR